MANFAKFITLHILRKASKMTEKEDLRVRKTKKALAESFMSLMSEKPFDQITINELCDRANIRRATFYKHYTDKFDYLAAFTRALRDNFDSYIWKASKPDATNAYYVAYVKGVLEFIDHHKAIVDNLMGSGLFPSVLAIIMEENYKDTEERLRVSMEAGMKLNVHPDVAAAMLTGGIATIIYAWLKTGKKRTSKELISEINALIVSTIR